MALFKTFTKQEQEFWDKWYEYSIFFTRNDLARILSVTPNRISKPLLRELFYRVGVQPHEFLIANHSGTKWNSPEFEIRFAGPEVVSLLRLAGMIS